MSTGIDTLKIYERLKTANLDEVATKQDIALLRKDLEGEIKLLKWMMGAVLAGIISLILKTFFA